MVARRCHCRARVLHSPVPWLWICGLSAVPSPTGQVGTGITRLVSSSMAQIQRLGLSTLLLVCPHSLQALVLNLVFLGVGGWLVVFLISRLPSGLPQPMREALVMFDLQSKGWWNGNGLSFSSQDATVQISPPGLALHPGWTPSVEGTPSEGYLERLCPQKGLSFCVLRGPGEDCRNATQKIFLLKLTLLPLHTGSRTEGTRAPGRRTLAMPGASEGSRLSE